RLEDPEVLAECIDRLDQLVLKPVDGSGGYGLVVGPHATDAQLAAVRAEIVDNPRGWIAQELVMLSTAPSQSGESIAARHVDLRPFAMNDGERISVLPGGLTRVALRAGSLVVNSSQGGGSKDTWVLTTGPERVEERDWPTYEGAEVQSVAPDLGPLSGQQEQQQQSGARC
ncbi:MAG: circularly permuted type 2 ATP-grasp protein, partial [Mycobacteriales bacterium]